MSATRVLASYLSNLRYEDLPPAVVEKGKLAIIDAVGNAVGGYPLGPSRTFLELARDLGGGRPEATLIGDGNKVSVPLAAFGNGPCLQCWTIPISWPTTAGGTWTGSGPWPCPWRWRQGSPGTSLAKS